MRSGRSRAAKLAGHSGERWAVSIEAASGQRAVRGGAGSPRAAARAGMGFRGMVVTALAALLLCGASLAAPAAGGDMPRDMGGGSDAAGLEEELHVGAAELAAVPAESRAVLAKVLGRLEGLRGEMEELKAGKARSDERIAQHEYGRPSWRARRARTRRTGRRQRRPSWKTTHSRVGLGSPPRPGGGASLRARAGRWTPAAWASRGLAHGTRCRRSGDCRSGVSRSSYVGSSGAPTQAFTV